MVDEEAQPSEGARPSWEARLMDWARQKQAAEAPPPVAAEDARPEAGRSGGEAEIDLAAARRQFDESAFHRALGLTLEELRPGFARVRLKTSSFTLGGVAASVHGGILAAMVDIAMLRALVPMLGPSERPAGTIDLNITYLRPSLGPYIDAVAEVLRKGRTVAVSEVSIVDSEGKLCAKGRTIYALRPVES